MKRDWLYAGTAAISAELVVLSYNVGMLLVTAIAFMLLVLYLCAFIDSKSDKQNKA
jgi:hypothetical protein